MKEISLKEYKALLAKKARTSTEPEKVTLRKKYRAAELLGSLK